jgi:ketosteroid isomerase-like protein
MSQRTADEQAIRQRIETLIQGIRDQDLDGVRANYAPAIVSFDVEPPLEHLGSAAKSKNWTKVFSAYQRPIDYGIRDLTIAVGDAVAFAHGLVHIAGTLNNGQKTEHWLRATMGLRRIAGDWVIVHDHVSVPTDVESGRALLDLAP